MGEICWKGEAKCSQALRMVEGWHEGMGISAARAEGYFEPVNENMLTKAEGSVTASVHGREVRAGCYKL